MKSTLQLSRSTRLLHHFWSPQKRLWKHKLSLLSSSSSSAYQPSPAVAAPVASASAALAASAASATPIQRLKHPLRRYTRNEPFNFIPTLSMFAPSASKIPSYHHQKRQFFTEALPEALSLANFSLWGTTGVWIKALHHNLGLPYWACFSVMSLSVRVFLFPLVLRGARVIERFAKVLPEIAFAIKLYRDEATKLNKVYTRSRPDEKRMLMLRQLHLFKMNVKIIRLIYRDHKIHPLAILLSPLIQLPVFLFISMDLRKIVNGLDLVLANDLVEAKMQWIPDLTEPDPWFGLPIMSGVLMYVIHEVNFGPHNPLSLLNKATTTDASNTADAANTVDAATTAANTPRTPKQMNLLAFAVLHAKDIFQSLSLFMPSFTSQLPAGMQIYITTSFVYTLLQTTALRTDSFRIFFGLSPLGKVQKQDVIDSSTTGASTRDNRTATQMFIDWKKLDLKAQEERQRTGSPLLGTGVLDNQWTTSFPGEYRKSTIQGSQLQRNAHGELVVGGKTTNDLERHFAMTAVFFPSNAQKELSFSEQPFIHGISAPFWQLKEQQREQELLLWKKKKRKEISTSPINLRLSSKWRRGKKMSRRK